MALYCTPEDLYEFGGLARGDLSNPSRLIASVSVSGGVLYLDSHGLVDGTPITFRLEPGGVMPAPLVAGTTYYAIPVTGDAFQVSATDGGSAVTLTTSGDNVAVGTELPITGAIAWASRTIDDQLPGHLVPLPDVNDVAPAPVLHDLIRYVCAELAAQKLLARAGNASSSFSAMIEEAHKKIARWAKGVPVRGENVPPPANLAAAASAPYRDPRGWNRWGGIC